MYEPLDFTNDEEERIDRFKQDVLYKEIFDSELRGYAFGDWIRSIKNPELIDLRVKNFRSTWKIDPSNTSISFDETV